MRSSIALCLAHSLSQKLGEVAQQSVAVQKPGLTVQLLHAACLRLPGPAQLVFPAPVPGPFHISHLLPPFLHLSSVLFPMVAPATHLLLNGTRVQSWLLEFARLHCCLLFMGGWSDCSLETRHYHWSPFAWCWPMRSPADLIRAG